MPESIDTPTTPDAIFGKDAVSAALADHAAIQQLQQFITDAKWDREELTLTVGPETIVQANNPPRPSVFSSGTAYALWASVTIPRT